MRPAFYHIPRSSCAVVAALVVGLTGCQVLTTHGLGVSDTAQVTESLGGIAATGDTAACAAYGQCADGAVPPERPPAELTKMSLPTYRIEPPDVLLINAVRIVPKDPYFIRPLDILQIVVANSLPTEPIAGTYQVESSGVVNLGPSYGPVKIDGLTIDEASDKIAQHLRRILSGPAVSVSLLQAFGQQQIAGEHLVAPDGTINLGIYGTVYISGLTVQQARQAVEQRLSEFFDGPEVSLDVFAYNSKVYYIITEGASFGDQVVRLPVTGNETVLDALAQIGGISQFSSSRMWISRPAPHGNTCDQVLPIDWNAITRGANTCTNYQILPGDRIFVASDRLQTLNGWITKFLNPIERAFGFTLLGSQTIQTLQRFPRGTIF